MYLSICSIQNCRLLFVGSLDVVKGPHCHIAGVMLHGWMRPMHGLTQPGRRFNGSGAQVGQPCHFPGKINIWLPFFKGGKGNSVTERGWAPPAQSWLDEKWQFRNLSLIYNHRIRRRLSGCKCTQQNSAHYFFGLHCSIHLFHFYRTIILK